MKLILVILLLFCFSSCHQSYDKNKSYQPNSLQISPQSKSYKEIKNHIALQRRGFAKNITTLSTLTKSQNIKEITNFWVTAISKNLYEEWQATPWDFNGTTTQPKQGAIACGYFVTTILKDMGLIIDRKKLSICASSVMMKSLTPRQKIKNLSYLSYQDFNDTLKLLGKGVYIIGLDFHTGFIVNDSTENWFIHSNYIERKGVTKEKVLASDALRSSKTRWLISLTNDMDFLFNWLKGSKF